jgi:hypothetical protein
MSEQSTVAVGLSPHRSDGQLTLHVGSSFIRLSKDEAERLAKDIASKATGHDVIGWQIAARATST